MKKALIPAMALVLTMCLLTGCRDRNMPMETTRPTTAATTAPTIMPTTEPDRETTSPTAAETAPRETVDHGNGPVDGTDGTDTPAGSSGTTEETGSLDQSRSRGRMPSGK